MAAEAEEKTNEVQGTDDLDDRFLVYAEDEDGWAIVQFTSRTGNILVYTAHTGSRPGRFYRRSMPREVFFDLAREVLEKLDAGEIEEVE